MIGGQYAANTLLVLSGNILYLEKYALLCLWPAAYEGKVMLDEDKAPEMSIGSMQMEGENCMALQVKSYQIISNI